MDLLRRLGMGFFKKKPDIKFAAKLLMDVQDLVWSNE